MQQVLSKWNRNEKGFTLVELLAVIVILGIILAIAIPAIGNILDGAKSDTTENQNELIIDAARIAEANNAFEGDEITVEKLIKDGYLEKNENTESMSSKKVVKDKDSDGDPIYKIE